MTERTLCHACGTLLEPDWEECPWCKHVEKRQRAARAASKRRRENPHALAGIDVERDLCTEMPRAGEEAALYGKGFGYTVRGIVIGGRVYRYWTEEEEVKRHQQEVEKQEREHQAKLDEEREDRDRRIAALPQPLQDRIVRFQTARATWRRDFEPYELFVCEEAAKIATWLETQTGTMEERATRFERDREIQKQVLGEESYANHSGNTFSAAVGLALRLLETPDVLPRAHGALCPLVGCEEYGCWAADKDKDAPA